MQQSQDLQIRPLTRNEYRLVVDFQKNIWEYSDLQIRSVDHLISLEHKGGHILGAFLDGEFVGFCIDEPSNRNGELAYYSTLLGVKDGHRDSGIGYRLKLAQRERVLQDGAKFVHWTFDPLQSRNAFLNIHNLGATVREYRERHYESAGGQFNQGLDADRVVALWYIDSERVMSHINGTGPEHNLDGHTAASRTRVIDDCFVVPTDLVFDPISPLISIEAPYDIKAISTYDTGIAREWQAYFRSAFPEFFNRGFVVTGFAKKDKQTPKRNFYLLTRDFHI